MYEAASPSDPPAAAAVPSPVRANARVAIGFKQDGHATRLAHLAETDGYRVKLPRTDGAPEAVVINTGGGMAGGDRLTLDVACADEARATVTTQSAEKIYRAEDRPCEVEVRLSVGDRAALDWLPQETILFSGARMRRNISVVMEESASILIAETLVFGRMHSGERLGEGLLSDRWRVRRGGSLCFADDARFEGQLDQLLSRRAVAASARAIATLLLVSPDSEAFLEPLRRHLETLNIECGCSAWNGMLLARFSAGEPAELKLGMASALRLLRSTDLPRVWQC
jgi:urease accessory protein